MAHRILKRFVGVGVLALLLIAATPAAQADLSIVSVNGGAPNTGVNYLNFNDLRWAVGAAPPNQRKQPNSGEAVAVSFVLTDRWSGIRSGHVRGAFLLGQNDVAFDNPSNPRGGPDKLPYRGRYWKPSLERHPHISPAPRCTLACSGDRSIPTTR